MSRQSERMNAHERDYWLRHDAHRFIRHDFKRFLAPGTDPADVFPPLARQRDREEAAFKAQIERGYRLIATLRAEVASIKADLLRRRLAEQTKYSPTQTPIAFASSSGMTRVRGAAIGCTRHFRSTIGRRGDRRFA